MELEKIENNYPYNLLLLADETIEAINKYLFDSDVYIAKTEKETVGVFCLLAHDEETIEIMNIAVSLEMQNKGIGSHLMSEIEKIARKGKYKTIIVGTADCGFKQIHFYEKNGYSRYDLKKDFFLEKFGEPIFENGIMLKDMVMLRKKIENIEIEKADFKDYNDIIAVWESSVKATHDFLKSEDFDFYRKVIPGFLSQVDLYILRSEGKISAFMGISGENLEMLFVSDESRGKGYGKYLLETAITKNKIKKVDVNEQNRQAIGFYEKFGFRVINRSEKDPMNKDYPILHLSL
ncbi:MAG: GNAT family N-acetyltransferase [Bacteroidales bacterium]|jgi:aminoglycoside 6'-N-acetyltransferase I|nr:GNAT family N-acetyltransferase [Bacteroidales bacterium]